jgi:hypothetical protein
VRERAVGFWSTELRTPTHLGNGLVDGKRKYVAVERGP